MRQRRRCDYRYLGVDQDKLFAAAYQHKHRGPQPCSICSGESDSFCEEAARTNCTELYCDESQLVPRKGLEAKRRLTPDDMQCPAVLVGRIASGYTVMKSGEHCNRIAREHNVIAFKIEGAGV